MPAFIFYVCLFGFIFVDYLFIYLPFLRFFIFIISSLVKKLPPFLDLFAFCAFKPNVIWSCIPKVSCSNNYINVTVLLTLTAAVSNTSTPTPTGSSQQGQPPVAPPPPQYAYQEINVASLAGLAPHIQINGQVGYRCGVVKYAPNPKSPLNCGFWKCFWGKENTIVVVILTVYYQFVEG